MKKLRLTDYLTDIESEEGELLVGDIFAEVNYELGYAIPNKRYWHLWNSGAKQALRDAGLRPVPFGDQFGRATTWYVYLPIEPSGGTQHISEALKSLDIALLAMGR